MYPHERSLVKKLANQPFALIGVNSDPKEILKTVLVEKDLIWRSFWDGGTREGPIATKWNISGWPTVYVIDANGVIRYKNVYRKALDDAIDKLLKEIKSTEE